MFISKNSSIITLLIIEIICYCFGERTQGNYLPCRNLKCKYGFYLQNSVKMMNIHSNDSVQISSDGEEQIVLKKEHFCIDSFINEDTANVKFCIDANFCSTHLCIQKCCPQGESNIKKQCQKHANELFYNEMNLLINVTKYSGYGIVFNSVPNCTNKTLVDKNDTQSFKDGELHTDIYETPFDTSEYCSELYDDRLSFAACFRNGNIYENPVYRLQVNAAFEIISCIFLLITFLVYLFLPHLHGNLHGKNMLCYCFCLFAAYFCLVIVGIGIPPPSPEQTPTQDFFCKFFGYLTLFSFSSAFSWLNIMGYDIWTTFKGFSGVNRRRDTQQRRFLFYSIYGWSFPSLITSAAIFVDQTKALAFNLRPNIGFNSCWIEQLHHNFGELIYFNGPVGLQLMINILFFILTSHHCNKVKSELSQFSVNNMRSKKNKFETIKNNFVINIKLFIVMGIPWMLEIISFILNNFFPDAQGWYIFFFYVTDCFNTLQGLVIFILFVLKKKVYNALMHKIHLIRNSTSNDDDPDGDYFDLKVKTKSPSMNTLVSIVPQQK